MSFILWLTFSVIFIGYLAYQRVTLTSFTLGIATILALATVSTFTPVLVDYVLWGIFLPVAALLNISGLRRHLISRPVLAWFRSVSPALSKTEQEALAAGTVGWERALFSGDTDWFDFIEKPHATLTEEEQDFIDGPVQTLCDMVDEWQITHQDGDLPPEIWQYLKTQGFFGLIIPKRYGGKGFSDYAHSQILIKVASCSMTLAPTVTVPNSLGPGELLLHYGTQEQKDYYLPRLAKGQEIPCFALTGPEAGSDAGSIPDTGIICKQEFDGKETLGLRLNWDKRYITLAPVATVLGLAFKAYDPDHLLGAQEEYGITCALIPTTTPGITIGRRHLALNTPFQNGPTQGKDVFIPLEWIIGGKEQLGNGWRMLVECLSVGRSISLPSAAIGYAKAAAVNTGAYARIRKQFKVPIGSMEGVEEVITRIAGYTYLMESTQQLTLNAIHAGEKPSVPSAIVKYHTTELGRTVMNDAMDVHGGKGIMLGPKNYLGRTYQSVPIGITVEGANILTRCMIIFGQGAMRCHPHILNLLESAVIEDKATSLKEFDRHLFKQIGFTLTNIVRSLIINFTFGRFIHAPGGSVRRYLQKLSMLSTSFACLSDILLLMIGSDLKRKEKLSARLGDVLSDLYMCSALVKRFHEDHAPSVDLPILEWACRERLYHAQEQMHQILKNLPIRPLSIFLRVLIFPLGRRYSPPSDKLGRKVAELVLAPTKTRARIANGIFVPSDKQHPYRQLDFLIKNVATIEALEAKIKKAIKDGLIKKGDYHWLINSALDVKLITESEHQLMNEYETVRKAVIGVDDFDPSELGAGAKTNKEEKVTSVKNDKISQLVI